MRVLHRLPTALKYGALWLYLAVVVLPLFWVLYTSAKSTREIYKSPFALPAIITQKAPESGNPLAENYRNAWVKSHFSAYLFNSIKVVSLSLFFTVLLGAMAAYALARFSFFGRNAISVFFLAGLVIPMQLLVIPLFFQFTDISHFLTRLLSPLAALAGLGRLTVSLHDTHFGLILIYVAASLPFTIFVLTAFFRTLPGELREAALIDGCSEWQTFCLVMMPLARTGLTTVTIFNALGLWNEYLFGLVFLNSDAQKTLPLGLASLSMQAQYKSDIGLMFAGIVIVFLPTLLLYMLLQKQITGGVVAGAVKG